MKTRALLLVIGAFWTATTLAGPISQQQAQQTAYDFVQKHFTKGKTLRRAVISAEQISTSDTYYAFNIGNNEGFVLVSNDDRTVPILGYSTKGCFNLSAMPDNMRSFLAEYEEAIRNLQSNNAPSQQMTTSRRATEHITIDPIVKAHFNQKTPYWNDCPVLDYGGRQSHAPTGCVATAMAQIMATFQHPASTKAEIPSYQFIFNQSTYTVPAIKADSTIAWDKIALTYEEEYNNTPADSAIAALMAICGAAAQMNYGVNELGGSTTTADKAVEALVKYFDYEESTVRLVQRKDYSIDNWSDLIYKELKAGRPIIYSGLSTTNGHTFICDGYNAENEMFHINWGWGGDSDGWFRLTALIPPTLGIGGGTDNTGYGMTQTAIIGIQPNDGVTTPSPTILTVNTLFTKDHVTMITRENSTVPFTGLNICYEAANFTGEAHSFDAGLRIIDSDGNTVADIPDDNFQKRNMPNKTKWCTYPGNGNDYSIPITISEQLPNGNYRIIATSRVNGSGEMHPDINADTRFIDFTIYNDNLSISDMYKVPVFGLSITDEIEIKPVTEGASMAGKPHLATFIINNNGTHFRGDIYYTVNEADPSNPDKQVSQGTFIDMPEGYSWIYTIRFTPNKEEVNTLRLYAYDDDYNWRLLGTQTVTVSGAPDIKLFVTDIENYDTEQGAVVGNKLTMKVKMVNEGAVAFNGSYNWFLDYIDEKTNDWVKYNYFQFGWWQLSLGPGQEEEKTFTWDNLSYNTPYRIYFENSNDNTDYMYTEEVRFTETSGIDHIAAGTDIKTNIFTLQGISVGKNRQKLTPGIYIQKGKKIMVK